MSRELCIIEDWIGEVGSLVNWDSLKADIPIGVSGVVISLRNLRTGRTGVDGSSVAPLLLLVPVNDGVGICCTGGTIVVVELGISIGFGVGNWSGFAIDWSTLTRGDTTILSTDGVLDSTLLGSTTCFSGEAAT